MKEMNTYYAVVRNDRYLEHHGIKGQKWGIRRYQNPDGSLTIAGRDRYATSVVGFSNKRVAKAERKYEKAKQRYKDSLQNKNFLINRRYKQYKKRGQQLLDAYDQLSAEYDIERSNAKRRAENESYKKETRRNDLKIEKNRKIEKESGQAVKDIDAKAEKITNELVRSGMKVTIDHTKRSANTGRSVVLSLGITAAMNKAFPKSGAFLYKEKIQGNKHTVTRSLPSTKRRIDDRRGESRIGSV